MNAAGAGAELEVAGAEKRYGRSVALAGVDLLVGAGRFLVLLGPSGSGKSTLARCLAGVERLDGGRVVIGGRLAGDARRHLPPERRNLAMVFQDYALWPHLTARANVAYALRRHRLAAGEARRRTGEALEQVGLGDLAERYPSELSGGEQQRVALARALVARPGLLIFDEPLSNLDADLRERLRVEIATLTRESGATAVYITHDQAEAFALADDMAVLDRGHLVQFAPPEVIYHRPATPFVARFTGTAGEMLGHVEAVGGSGAGARVSVAVTGGTVTCGSHDDFRRGEPARVVVRPAATGLAPVAAAGEACLRGRVVDVAYRGRGYDHVVACEAGTFTGVFDPRRWERDDAVALVIDPEGAIAYRGAGAPSGRPSIPAVVTVAS